MKTGKKYLSQVQFIALGFFIMIMLGTFILMLPISSKNNQFTDFLTALFTATSASCVTGLVVVDTATYWSIFGQVIILLLIQVGGLGFISIGVFFSIILRRKIGLRERGLIMESTNSLKIGGVVKLTRKILFGTLIFEGSGMFLFAFRFIPEYGFVKGLWFSLFHSVSAFCNAGFDLMGDKYGKFASVTAYYNDVIVNVVIMLLIIIGGIGFVVWNDIYENGIKFRKYSLHTKIVLVMTFILVFGGGLLFFITEQNGVIKDMNFTDKVLASLFSSVTARTAGFNTVDTGKLSDAGKLLTMFLMFIGGSSGSTAGGVKTTTIFVIFANVKSTITRTFGMNVFDRRINEESVYSAATIAAINLGLVVLSVFVVMIIQPLNMIEVFFEAFSAIGTVGMTTGITRDLSIISKFIMILLMYIGRVGSLSFAFAFVQNKTKPKIIQPKESISIG